MTGKNDIKPLDDTLNVRINRSDKLDFVEKSAQVGKLYPHLMREIITAFIDGRLRIIPTEDQKTSLGELYNVTGK